MGGHVARKYGLRAAATIVGIAALIVGVVILASGGDDRIIAPGSGVYEDTGTIPYL